MPSVYRKGGKWWCKLKGDKVPGKWSAIPTPYKAEPELKEHARRWAEYGQKKIDARAALGPAGAITVANYADQWLAAPSRKALASYPEMVGHLRNHVLPRIGQLRIRELRPRHVRDVVRGLKQLIERGDLSPKTVLNVYGTMRTMLHDAVVDEVITASPCVVSRDELPAKVDKDPEWRELATYERAEVVRILTATKIPPERRVQCALKALAGLRHGEVAGLRWRMWLAMEPLGRLSIARTYTDKRTKTKVTRAVPVHRELARMLEAWQAMWEGIYGHAPGPDDFIVPTRNLTPIDPSDAVVAFKVDLDEIGLRVAAGEHRDRGGHDLRAWFISTALEDGAAADALYTVTHTKKKDVASGYNRQRWKRLCDAVGCLEIQLGDDPLPVGPDELPRQRSLRRAYEKRGLARRKAATPTGFEPVGRPVNVGQTDEQAAQSARLHAPCDVSLAGMVAVHGTSRRKAG